MLLVLLPLLARSSTADDKKIHLEKRDTGWDDSDLTLVEMWCGLVVHVRNDGSLDPEEDFWDVDHGHATSGQSCPDCVAKFTPVRDDVTHGKGGKAR